ncbi:unnamed protein product [Kuraishia capsulata CBS 1993]|uniref:Amino acid permease/ SLC12A domain-containing protein n=1 Tax=Kuraishia capsulata CBS 1993 TaxID=1382522 RepID=W6MN52_9ASCO|nr:uncharacterized protein KUCA_T00004035001 [Kuraishia capsulata CBS 1993]CDK28054.1 unnamed protein product [Kuraishia capsulata CBS 1993]
MADDKLDIKVTYSRYHDIAPGNIDALHAHSDNELLAEIGYKAELKRRFSTLQVFGVAFSIMGLLPSIASVLATALSAGATSLTWGWFLASFGVLLIGISMAELGSAIPTSGGLYYWSHFYAPEKWKIPISYIVGNTNSVALVGALCSVDYGFAGEVLAAVVLQKDGDFVITSGKTYGVYAACVVSHIAVTCFASNFVSRLQTFSICCNLGLIVLFFIAVPIGCAKNGVPFNDGKFIFGNNENFSPDWNKGWNWMLCGIMPSVWTIGAFDSCVHMSEEARNATRSVPIGIIGSITACYSLGFFICIVLAACMGPDVSAIIHSEFGSPIAQIIYNALGKNWAIAFMSLIAFCQWLMGASILTAISRQIWAFARDNGLPFCSFVKVVNKKLSTPIRAVFYGGILALIMGCLCLIGTTAANALFSLYIAGNYFSWGTPIFLRLTSGRSKFVPGNFYLGDRLSPIIGWSSIVFIVFVIILVMFPADSVVTKDTMNYTVVITPGVMILAWIYYFAYGRKIFKGPRSNLEEPSEYHEGDPIGEDEEIAIVTSMRSAKDEIKAIKSRLSSPEA